MAIELTSEFCGQTVKVKSHETTLSNDTFVQRGATGEVHRIGRETAIKVYRDQDYAAKMKNKVMILCGKAHEFHQSVVCPRAPVFIRNNGASEKFRGFAMKLVKNACTLEGVVWNKNIPPVEEDQFDCKVAAILYEVCSALETVHRSWVVIGDLKPANILLSGNQVFLIDFDSCSMLPELLDPNYDDKYLDPRLRNYSPDKPGPYPFDTASDWFAVAVTAFQMFLGVLPWDGIHPSIRTKVGRACSRSVVGFDPQVRIPSVMRPMEWLHDKQKLSNYFQDIFVNDTDSSRRPIAGILPASFHGCDTKEHMTYKPPSKLLDKLSQEQKEMYKNVFVAIDARSTRKDRQSQGREQFLKLMLHRFE